MTMEGEKTKKTITQSGTHPTDSEHKESSASPAKPEKDLIREARGDSWRHKSSWTQLISTSNHSSFSLSEIVSLPDLRSKNHEPEVVAPVKDPNAIPVGGRKEISSQRKRNLIIGSLESEESCPFMRTEASMKEWKKAKSSLSSSLNKKKRKAL